VSLTPDGKVTSSPAGIDCTPSCIAPFAYGTKVTLTATPADGYGFVGWSSACDGSTATTCDITVTGPGEGAVAEFSPYVNVGVLASSSGSGGLASKPAGIACTNDPTSGLGCAGVLSAAFLSGTKVSLIATPASGSTFGGWTGYYCAGQGLTCSFTVEGGAAVGAAFVANRTLTLTKSGSGKGAVVSAPAGIDCPASCAGQSAGFKDGTRVTLTASAAPGFVFLGWSGACAGTGGCSTTLSANASVGAAFGPPGSTPPPAAASTTSPPDASPIDSASLALESESAVAGGPGATSTGGTDAVGPTATTTVGAVDLTPIILAILIAAGLIAAGLVIFGLLVRRRA